MMKVGKAQEDFQDLVEDQGLGQEAQENCVTIHRNKILLTNANAFSGHNNFEPN